MIEVCTRAPTRAPRAGVLAAIAGRRPSRVPSNPVTSVGPPRRARHRERARGHARAVVAVRTMWVSRVSGPAARLMRARGLRRLAGGSAAVWPGLRHLLNRQARRGQRAALERRSPCVVTTESDDHESERALAAQVLSAADGRRDRRGCPVKDLVKAKKRVMRVSTAPSGARSRAPCCAPSCEPCTGAARPRVG